MTEQSHQLPLLQENIRQPHTLWPFQPSFLVMLSVFLRAHSRLQNNSYQKKMRPVETAAFSKLGERPLKNPPGPSSRAICLMQSRRPRYIRTWERNGKEVKQEKSRTTYLEKNREPQAIP